MSTEKTPNAMELGRKLLLLAEHMKQIAATVAGYRRELVTGGFSEKCAESMALQMHEVLLSHINSSAAAARRAASARGGAAPEVPDWLRSAGGGGR